MVRSTRQMWTLGLVLLLGGCASSRTVQVSAARPAQLLADGCVVCEGIGPCSFTFSRETCGLFDSSKGYIVFQAVLPDGRCQILAARTCELEAGERVHLDLDPGQLRKGIPCWPQGERWGPPSACARGADRARQQRSLEPVNGSGSPPYPGEAEQEAPEEDRAPRP